MSSLSEWLERSATVLEGAEASTLEALAFLEDDSWQTANSDALPAEDTSLKIPQNGNDPTG